MDVTALLNSCTPTEEQRREENLQTPTRTRTPWDAGGYSLPFALKRFPDPTSPRNAFQAGGSASVCASNGSYTSKGSLTPITSSSFVKPKAPFDDIPFDKPVNAFTASQFDPMSFHLIHFNDSQAFDLSRHKLSDSRSSLSSFDSFQSTTHSRLSSLSTVYSAQNPSTNICSDHLASTSTPEPRFQTMMGSPPIDPLNVLARDAEDRLRDKKEKDEKLDFTLDEMASSDVTEDRMNDADRGNPDDGAIDSMIMEYSSQDAENINRHGMDARSGSPSDAMLIPRRTYFPRLRVDTTSTSLNASNVNNGNTYLSAPVGNRHQNVLHRRTASAPAPAHLSRSPASLGPSAGAPPPSQNLVADSSQPPEQPPDTPSDAGSERPSRSSRGRLIYPDNLHIPCQYIPNCQTGSTRRKAISHIFGRNKKCTRQVPEDTWVHYCRKHYQRSRYRNPKEYAKLQCDLVQQQIRRIHDWSQENLRSGNGGVVRDWTLAMRKREQKRLQELKANNRKRGANIFDEESEDDEEEEDGGSVPTTAVPRWLQEFCGAGYSTKEMLEIFNKLHEDVLADKIQEFPDIEILPNVIGGEEEPRTPSKRKPSSGHQRAQSLGIPKAVKSSSSRPGQPFAFNNKSAYDTPFSKRRRGNDEDEDEDERPALRPTQSFRSRQIRSEAGRRLPIPHRPTHSSIAEDQSSGIRPSQMQMGGGRHAQPALPAPTPQRPASRSVAADLENDSNAPRPIHQRSVSDVAGPRRSHTVHTRSSSSTVQSIAPYTRNDILEQRRTNSLRGVQQGHMRVQSSPIHARFTQGYRPEYYEARSAVRGPDRNSDAQNRENLFSAQLARLHYTRGFEDQAQVQHCSNTELPSQAQSSFFQNQPERSSNLQGGYYTQPRVVIGEAQPPRPMFPPQAGLLAQAGHQGFPFPREDQPGFHPSQAHGMPSSRSQSRPRSREAQPNFHAQPQVSSNMSQPHSGEAQPNYYLRDDPQSEESRRRSPDTQSHLNRPNSRGRPQTPSERSRSQNVGPYISETKETQDLYKSRR